MIQFLMIFILLLSYKINGADEAPPAYESLAEGEGVRKDGFIWEHSGTTCYKVKDAVEMMKIVDGCPGNIAIEFRPPAESIEWFRCEKSEGRLPAWFLRSDLLRERFADFWDKDQKQRIYRSTWANWSEVGQIVMLGNGYDKGNRPVPLRELLGQQFPHLSAFNSFYNIRIAKVREQHQGLEIVKNWGSIRERLEQGVSDFTHRVDQAGQQIARLEQVVEKQGAGWQHCLEQIQVVEQTLRKQQAALTEGNQIIQEQINTQQAGMQSVTDLNKATELNERWINAHCRVLVEIDKDLEKTKVTMQQLQADVAAAAPAVQRIERLLALIKQKEKALEEAQAKQGEKERAEQQQKKAEADRYEALRRNMEFMQSIIFVGGGILASKIACSYLSGSHPEHALGVSVLAGAAAVGVASRIGFEESDHLRTSAMMVACGVGSTILLSSKQKLMVHN